MGSETVQVAKGIEIIDLALYLDEENILVIADLHIGIEDSLVKQGMLVPKFHFRDLVDRVERIFKSLAAQKKEVKVVVINGDLKHEFGRISDEEWRNTLKMLDWLSRKCEKIVLVRGNHDTILGPIAEKRKVMFVDSFLAGDILICHGDTIPEIPSSVKTIIIGHEHPAVSIHEDLRKETYKAFVAGKWNRKNIIVQPSLNPLMEGTDIKSEKLLSPFLQKKLDEFEVYIVADKVYGFGKLKKLYKY
ncbi:metallophosphoesterase [Candidatus Woesearchaeota archaeon]|nr:metallophosphoesterase [Candidatus Woesearchaeota archaeon]